MTDTATIKLTVDKTDGTQEVREVEFFGTLDSEKAVLELLQMARVTDVTLNTPNGDKFTYTLI